MYLSARVTIFVSCLLYSATAQNQVNRVMTEEITEMVKISSTLSNEVYNGASPGDVVRPDQIGFYLDNEDAVLTVKYEDKFCIASFRGTTLTGDDWFQNIDAFPMTLVPGTSCTAPRGWLNAYQSPFEDDVVDDIENCMTECPTCKAVMTGHSQGGAIAQIAGIFERHLAPYVAMFGAPGALSDECYPYVGDSRNWLSVIQGVPISLVATALFYDIIPTTVLGNLFGHEIYVNSEDNTGVAYTGRNYHVDNFPYSPTAHSMATYEATMNAFGPTINTRGWASESYCTEDWECRSGECSYRFFDVTYKCD